MDKNYNVDDILSEIKNRKMREKAGKTQDAATFDKPASAKPAREEEFKLDFSPKEPKPARPAREEEFKLDFSPKEPKPARPAREEEFKLDFSPKEPKPARPAREEEFKLDFSPKEPKPARPVREEEFKLDFSPKEPKPVKPAREKEFNLIFTPEEPAPQNTAPPFSETPAKGFAFTPQNLEKDFTLDTSPLTEETPPEPVPSDTRVMPQFTSTKDFNVEDIQKMDFSKTGKKTEDADYYDPEDAYDDTPAGSAIDYSEYNSVNDRRSVQRDIAQVKLWLFLRTSATLVLTVVLFVLALSGRYSIPLPPAIWPEVPETLRAYLLTCTIITVLVALVNSSTVGGGLMALFKMHANSDSLAACAVLAAVGQGIVVVAKPELAQPTKLSLYFCIAALALLFNALGKMMMINRILANFRILSSEKDKKALLAVEDDGFCHEFVKDVSRRRPTIVYSVRAGFFTDFLGLSYSDKYDVGINRAVAPVCLIGALIVCAATYFLTGSTLASISALTAILCVSATLSSTFIENVPLAKLTKKLAPQGGMVSGTKAVEDFCDTKALVLTENDLFPQGNVYLNGIRSFMQSRIDEAILDAASVICALNGALGPVFLQMIGGDKRLLRKTDNIVFENGMGISAWVNSRRVLIGNRQLMVNHGIALPQEIMQQKQAPSEILPLFIAIAGELSAQFTVSYHIDEDLALSLDEMAQRDMLLIVHTIDANITARKLFEWYGYPEELIRVLPAEWHPQYQRMITPRETAVAEIVYTGKATAFVKAILACITARSSILSATMVQLVQIVLGYGLLAFMAFIGKIDEISVLYLCAYQMFWFLSIFIVQSTKQS